MVVRDTLIPLPQKHKSISGQWQHKKYTSLLLCLNFPVEICPAPLLLIGAAEQETQDPGRLVGLLFTDCYLLCNV